MPHAAGPGDRGPGTGFGGPGGGIGDPGKKDNLGAALNNSLNPAIEDPILQAARLQSEALESIIPLFQPFLDAGNQGLGFLRQAGTAGGLDEILSMIFGGESFEALRGERERGVIGALGAGGLTRSGEAIEQGANIGSDLGLDLFSQLLGINTDLTNQGGGAAFNIGNLTTGSAEATASGILGVEERNINRSTNRSNNQSQILGAVLGGLFSDPRLKENIKVIGHVGQLPIVEWDWRPEFKDTIVMDSPTVGFLSTDIKEIYPDLVGEFGGFDIINYPELIRRI